MTAHQTLSRFALLGLLLAIGCGRSPASPDSVAIPSSVAGLEAKPSPNQPATSTFRCPGAECVSADRIQGDGAPYASVLNTNSELHIDLTAARTFGLDFTDGPAPCAGCRRTFTTLVLSASNATQLQTNVVIPGTDTEASNGLLAIPVGATWPSKMKLIFNHNGFAWAVRFNPRDYPGSTHLNVTRVDATTWIIEATTAHLANFVSIGDRRNGGKLSEGFFVMPFRIRVTRP